MQSHKTVEEFLEQQSQWKEQLIQFREILLPTELTETIKWGMPVYTINGKNVVGLGAFKSYVGIWFYQGSFLRDPHNLLVNAQDGKTKGMRQLRFGADDLINDDIILQYVEEAIQNQKDGKEIKPDTKKPLVIPDELQTVLNSNEKLKESFLAFTPGKQKEFANHIAEVKKTETKQKRIEKIIPMIMNGVGLNDKYKSK